MAGLACSLITWRRYAGPEGQGGKRAARCGLLGQMTLAAAQRASTPQRPDMWVISAGCLRKVIAIREHTAGEPLRGAPGSSSGVHSCCYLSSR
jgi:hypothetical protein